MQYLEWFRFDFWFSFSCIVLFRFRCGRFCFAAWLIRTFGLPDSDHTENSENSTRNGQQKLQAFRTLVENLEVASREAGSCAGRKAIVFRIQDFLSFLFH